MTQDQTRVLVESDDLAFSLLPGWNDLSEACRIAMSQSSDWHACSCVDSGQMALDVYEALRKHFPRQPFPLFTVSKVKAKEMIEENEELKARALAAESSLNAAVSENARLRAALKGLSDMYGSTWDRVDGGLMMFDSGVERFEKAHKVAYDILQKESAIRSRAAGGNET